MAKGTFDGKQIRIAVGFQRKDWDRIEHFAKVSGVSMTEAIRRLALMQLRYYL